jgi:hypothetical protein
MSPLQGGDGRQTTLHFQAEDAAIVTYGPPTFGRWPGPPLLLALVGVHHFAAHVDSQLSREANARPYLPVDHSVEGPPAKGLLLPSHLGGQGARCVHRPNSVQENVGPGSVREDPDHYRQSHTT